LSSPPRAVRDGGSRWHHVAVPDNASLYSFVIDKLTERPEVADVHTSIVYGHIRNTRIAPAARISAPRPPAERNSADQSRS
jgi:hypothetical protein